MTNATLAEVQALTPKTLGGIKSVAKSLKRLTAQKHTACLDIAARQGGFANWGDALNRMSKERP
ncbi:MAG: hypothetical protein ACT6RD_03490 [Brevundimonas sp.]|uniref:hypothetical protein n=1 Tax=Brevundimonas sp. TaxID=1871086 RepID=UPI0040343CC4